MSATDIVPAANMAALDTLDTEARELAITGMLDNARAWLAHAVESTAPAQDINQFRQFIATAAETAKRLKVSKEIQQDAEVMVRRSERALGQAIRTGQEKGEISSRSSSGGVAVPGVRGTVSPKSLPDFDDREQLPSPSMFFSSGTDGHQTYAVTDDVTDDQFEEALDRAQEEKNASRANVVRKVRDVKSGAERQAEKWDHVASLAIDGYTSRQIAQMVGMSEGGLKEGARKRGIEFPADRAAGKRRRLDSDRILDGVTESVSAAAFSIQQIDPHDLDQEVAQEQIDSLTESINALRKAIKKIKESIS